MSTTEIEDTLRDRLLTFTGLENTTVADVLGRTETESGSDGKLFWDAVPDDVTTDGEARWGLLALKNRRSDGDGAERELAELEVMLFARPRNQKATMEQVADLCDQAMLRYTEIGAGWVVACWGRKRSTLPPFQSPADSEVVQIYTTYSLVLYPSSLTQYHDQA